MPFLDTLARLHRVSPASVSVTLGLDPVTSVDAVSGPARHYAPDGMEVNAPGARAATSLSRAQLLARAKSADVPQRVQQGPTCGLYALGMVMDFWHQRDVENPAPLVSDADQGGLGKHYNFAPTTDERILDVAQQRGYTAVGEMFTGRHLAETAAHFGYKASIHERATLDDLYAVLDKGHPAIVAFDVDFNGNPTARGGDRAHYAVVEGYFDDGGERYLVAKHGWGYEKDHVWRAKDFDRSWKSLKATSFYGAPGDGVIPEFPGVSEPARMTLPPLGDRHADIEGSLATKIIEVVPPGDEVVGGEIVVP
ncbi:MAG: C39 family peptidase [Myxococcota bacterium]